MIYRFIAAIFVATWLLWQLPYSSSDEVTLPELAAFAPFENAKTLATQTPIVTFYRRTDIGQYTAYGIDTAGAIVRVINLPGESVKKADDTTIDFKGKEGYITGPDNGAYYVWYPQLGTQAYLFNEQGNFLWDKEESHYLSALPRGRYIMAAAGDQSRLLFMNPDFKVQADFQGVLFTRFILDDDAESKTAQVCLGSLNGEIIIAHLDRRRYFRGSLGYALKALQCDFRTGEMAAIVERQVAGDGKSVQQDFLLRLRFQQDLLEAQTEAPPVNDGGGSMQESKKEPRTISTVAMPALTQTASPLVIAGDTICYLQAAGEALAVYYTTGKNAPLISRTIEGITAADFAPDTWRGFSLPLKGEQACLFTHRFGRLLVANGRGILLDRNDTVAERTIQRGDAVYIQTAKGILTLR